MVDPRVELGVGVACSVVSGGSTRIAVLMLAHGPADVSRCDVAHRVLGGVPYDLSRQDMDQHRHEHCLTNNGDMAVRSENGWEMEPASMVSGFPRHDNSHFSIGG